jgi:hypothetical protein
MTYYEITYIEYGKVCHVCVLAFSIVEAIESINKDVLGIAEILLPQLLREQAF